MSIDRSDDDAPTELDVDLSSSSSEEIATTVSRATTSIRDTLPADSEPRTLEPQMLVRGLGSAPSLPVSPFVDLSGVPSSLPDHPADRDGPTRNVEGPLLKAYAAEVQRAQGRAGAVRGVTLQSPVRAAPPARLAPVEDAEGEEETVTDARPTVDAGSLLESIEGADAVTTAAAPRMPSSSDLHTDPGIPDAGTTDSRMTDPRSTARWIAEPEIPDDGLPTLVADDDDERHGKGGTVKIIMTPPAMPVASLVSILEPPVPHAVTLALTPPPAVAEPPRPALVARPPAVAEPPPGPMATARRPRARKSRAGCAVVFVLVIASAALAAGVFFMKYGTPSILSRWTASSPAPSAPASVAPPPREPVASSSSAASTSPPASASALAPLATTSAAAPDPRDVATASGASEKPRGRAPKPGSRPSGKPAAPPPTSSGQKGPAPLHI